MFWAQGYTGKPIASREQREFLATTLRPVVGPRYAVPTENRFQVVYDQTARRAI